MNKGYFNGLFYIIFGLVGADVWFGTMACVAFKYCVELPFDLKLLLAVMHMMTSFILVGTGLIFIYLERQRRQHD